MTQTDPDVLSVVVEREIAHPPEKVWRALTQPHLVEEWLMKSDIRPEAGHSFTLSGPWGSVDCMMLDVEEPERLSYRWNHSHENPAFALESTVTFTLTKTTAGTLLRMEQVGFRAHQKQAFHGARGGWTQHLANLEKVVARLD
jgi:uncharacterized protein YndB with AHSA1/START domain